MKNFLERLDEQVMIGDGAMGTMLYARGISLNACYDYLNITDPDLVEEIHQGYLNAGAQLLETNTFTANRTKLDQFNLGKSVKEINAKGVEIARKVARDTAFVAGSVGPLSERNGNFLIRDMHEFFEEQITALVDAGVDLLILETFSNLNELKLALKVAKQVTNLPVICQMSFTENELTTFGVDPISAVIELEKYGADIVGVNCSRGPLIALKVMEKMAKVSKKKLSAFPNAGLPEYSGGRFMYLSTPEYHADMAYQMVQAGVNLVGGCCGTAPEHIRAIAAKLGGTRPVVRSISAEPVMVIQEKKKPPVAMPKDEHPFLKNLHKRTLIISEVDPPRGLDYKEILKKAEVLVEVEIDGVSVANNPLGITRMNNVIMAHMIEKELGLKPVVHFSCRDRNSIGMQSDLMGAYALGLDTILAITGDPAKIGDQPGATSVYDLNASKLLKLISNLNEGLNLAGASIVYPTSFLAGCGFNPNAKNLDAEIGRLKRKVESGAKFAQSQPLYEIERIKEVYKKTEHLGIPIFLGIMPLVSESNAKFLHNEVPGVRIPDGIMRRMEGKSKKEGRKEGLAIARELVEEALQYAPGVYLIPSFNRFDMAAELAEFVRSREKK